MALMEELSALAGLDEALLEPVVKTVALSILTRLTAEVCPGLGRRGTGRLCGDGGDDLGPGGGPAPGPGGDEPAGGDADMKKWVVLLLALALCVVPAAALDGETVPGWDGLWDQAEDYGVSQDTGLEGGLSQLVVQGLEQLKALAGRSIATGSEAAGGGAGVRPGSERRPAGAAGGSPGGRAGGSAGHHRPDHDRRGRHDRLRAGDPEADGRLRPGSAAGDGRPHRRHRPGVRRGGGPGGDGALLPAAVRRHGWPAHPPHRRLCGRQLRLGGGGQSGAEKAGGADEGGRRPDFNGAAAGLCGLSHRQRGHWRAAWTPPR